MMITDQLSAAVAAVLISTGLPHTPSIVSMVSDAENEEEVCRVIVTGTASELRKPSLPGIYDVSGEVVIQQAIQTTDAMDRFQSICNAIRQTIGAKAAMPLLIRAKDNRMYVFSWNLTGQENVNTAQCYLARFTWSACARQDPHNQIA